MIRWCSWCNTKIGEKEPLEDKSITYGICDSCAEKEMGKREDRREANYGPSI